MHTQKEAVALQKKPKSPPTVSSGEITACVIKEFENLCEDFFLQNGKTILESEHTASLFTCFESPMV